MVKKLGVVLLVLLLAVPVLAEEYKPKPLAFILFKVGNYYFNQGNLDSAEKLYAKAVGIDEKFSRAYYNLGVISYQRKDSANSEKWFVKAIDSDSNNAKAEYSLGILMFENQNYDEAIEHFRTTVALTPENENAHFDLAVALVDKYRSDGDSQLLTDALSQFESAPSVAHSQENADIIKKIIDLV